MREKESYSPQEVAEMCRTYHSVRGGMNAPVNTKVIRRYEEAIPKNIREIIDRKNNLERAAFSNISDYDEAG